MVDKNENTEWTSEDLCTLLAGRLRAGPRPMPWALLAMNTNHTATECERMLWGIATGYGGSHADGPRLLPRWNVHAFNTGKPWTHEQHRLLALGRGPQGQRRKPPVSTTYIGWVLGRTEADVLSHEEKTDPHAGMKGFF